MADLPELWSDRSPESRPDRSPEPLPDRSPALGAAYDLEPLPLELAPDDDLAPEPPASRRERGPVATYLFAPWSYGDGDRLPGEAWHRMKCRLRRHQMVGGQMVQVGGEMVFLERSCRWCGGTG